MLLLVLSAESDIVMLLVLSAETVLSTFIARREEEGPLGPFMTTKRLQQRERNVLSSQRRTKRPRTLVVGSVGLSVERQVSSVNCEPVRIEAAAGEGSDCECRPSFARSGEV